MTEQLRALNRLLGPRDRLLAGLLFLLILLCALLEVVGVAAVPAFIGVMIDPQAIRAAGLDSAADFIADIDTETGIIVGSSLLLAVFVVKTALLVLNFRYQVNFVSARRIDIAGRLIRAYMRAPYAFHLSRNTSELLRNIDREAEVIAYSVLAPLLEVTTRLVIVLAVLVFLFAVDPLVTVYWALLFGACGYVGTRLMGRKLKNAGLAEQRERQRFLQALNQAFGTVKEARVLNRESYFENRGIEALRGITEAMQFRLFSGKIIAPLTELIAVAGLLSLAALLMFSGRPADSIVVTLSLFVVGLVRLREAINASLYHLAGLRYNLVSVVPVAADLDRLEKEATPAPALGRPAPRRERILQDSIELRDLWHRYEDQDSPAIRDVNLQIPRGSVVGFVGGTGAGKSTLIDIILGLMPPERGQVLVDGRDIWAEGPAQWQSVIGYVPQSIFLMDDTVRRNIVLGLEDHEVDETALWRAVQRAQLEPFVARQRDGLDTVVGERGVRISGGERQRIGIARALYHDPEVLVLDEATSALDNETERAVVNAVQAVRGDRTIIMIAHRLTTVRNCDTLHFMEDGQIVTTGRYDELQAQNPAFRLMAQASSQPGD